MDSSTDRNVGAGLEAAEGTIICIGPGGGGALIAHSKRRGK